MDTTVEVIEDEPTCETGGVFGSPVCGSDDAVVLCESTSAYLCADCHAEVCRYAACHEG